MSVQVLSGLQLHARVVARPLTASRDLAGLWSEKLLQVCFVPADSGNPPGPG